jgi:hypothetical protein
MYMTIEERFERLEKNVSALQKDVGTLLQNMPSPQPIQAQLTSMTDDLGKLTNRVRVSEDNIQKLFNLWEDRE